MSQLDASEERKLAALCHLSSLCGFLIPFGNLITPLIIWIIYKEKYDFLDKHGRECLNFQISLTIYGIVSGLLSIVFIGFILLPIVIITGIILTVIAAVKANEGKNYRYPLTIRFL